MREGKVQIVVVLGKEGVSVPIEERYLDPELRKISPNCLFVQGVGFYVVAVLAEEKIDPFGVISFRKLESFQITALQLQDRVHKSSPLKELELGEMYLMSEVEGQPVLRKFDGFKSRQYQALCSSDKLIREICLVTSG